jgi:hypothetical protein
MSMMALRRGCSAQRGCVRYGTRIALNIRDPPDIGRMADSPLRQYCAFGCFVSVADVIAKVPERLS